MHEKEITIVFNVSRGVKMLVRLVTIPPSAFINEVNQGIKEIQLYHSKRDICFVSLEKL